MYILSVKKLANDFKNNKLSESDKFKYYFAIIVINTLLAELSLYTIQDFDLLNVSFSTLRAIVLLIAIIIIFYKNRAGDNKNFIERYACLGFPAAIQAILYFFGASIAFVFIGAIALGGEFLEVVPNLSKYATSVFSLAFLVIMQNLLIYNGIEEISKK